MYTQQVDEAVFAMRVCFKELELGLFIPGMEEGWSWREGKLSGLTFLPVAHSSPYSPAAYSMVSILMVELLFPV